MPEQRKRREHCDTTRRNVTQRDATQRNATRYDTTQKRACCTRVVLQPPRVNYVFIRSSLRKYLVPFHIKFEINVLRYGRTYEYFFSLGPTAKQISSQNSRKYVLKLIACNV